MQGIFLLKMLILQYIIINSVFVKNSDDFEVVAATIFRGWIYAHRCAFSLQHPAFGLELHGTAGGFHHRLQRDLT